MHVLLPCPLFLENRAVAILKVLDALLNHVLGALLSRDEDRLCPLGPLGPDLRNPVDQMRNAGPSRGDLRQSLAVRAVLAPQHEHHVGPTRQFADRFLAVRSRGKMSSLGGLAMLGTFRSGNDHIRIVDAGVVWVK